RVTARVSSCRNSADSPAGMPAVVIGLYTHWLHRWALVVGWVAGMIVGTAMVAAEDFRTSIYPLHLGALTIPGYAALYSLIINIVVVIVVTLILRAAHTPAGRDQTAADDYEREAA
ncbi:MAG: hypothetical protein ACRERZ_06760, partial [Gammaproteobacteria bacterium]